MCHCATMTQCLRALHCTNPQISIALKSPEFRPGLHTLRSILEMHRPLPMRRKRISAFLRSWDFGCAIICRLEPSGLDCLADGRPWDASKERWETDLMKPLIEVKGLRIAFGDAVPVRDVSFAVPGHGRVAIVGESGCGKSLTALSLWKDHPEVRISYIFQNPMESLNPVMKIGRQIGEARNGLSKTEIVDLLRRTGLDDPERVYGSYPCHLSGGQCQRAMIAMALAAKPDLLVADEPTTALDVTTQRDVLELIDSLATETGMAVLLITHNLGLVAGRMDFVNVMYAGVIVESGPVTDVLAHPHHPYTQGLLKAVPALDAPMDAPLADIPGTVPPPDAWPSGCAFHPRCPFATEICSQVAPPVKTSGPVRFACHNGE